eukprot:Plantae.Rhodophyta-Purpureofilum_apyrenoidigerum.ctg2631.p1 GENE.Plantae.Rhodophyta-Purpureofilum_apyrenoidigerum.ctg2631~~Plantae.Rhodophyta-Purpureofilum_apyrenoidigerum.ctg2631.p1  ORF type:complete len:310 (+),score=68.96 Plantae.Rhodophyta-Purpureofilum_apyrenoidigerum.ctg2631:135-1064(+)
MAFVGAATTRFSVGNSARKLQCRSVRGVRTSVRTMMAADSPMKDNKMLHVVYRVGNLDKTKEFYTKCLGMKVLRERDNPDEKYTNCFVGYGPEQNGEHFSIELTYNYGVEKYNLGDGFNHLGLCLPDVYEAAENAKQNGGKIIREAGPVKGGSTIIAFAEDPDGYHFEFVQRKQRDPLAQVSLRCGDLDKSIKFYRDALGMNLIRTMDVSEQKFTLAFLGYGPENDSTVMKLTYNYGVTKYDLGDAYGQIAVSSPDIYKAAEHIKAAGYEVARDPGPVPGIGTKITAVKDPDGYKIVIVDAEDFQKEFE